MAYDAGKVIPVGVLIQIPSPVALMRGKDHQIEIANPDFLKLTGFDDITGRSAREVFNGPDAADFLSLLDRVALTGVTSSVSEMPFTFKQGIHDGRHAYLNIEVQTCLTSPQEPTRLLVFAVDVSEHVQTRRRLELANAEITRLFNAVNEGFFSRDVVNNKYIHLSVGCQKIYGYPLEDFYSHTMLWYDVIHPDDKQRALADEVFLRAGKSTITEYRIIRKDGTVRWIELKVVPFMIDGELMRVEGIVTDITDRKHATEEREKMTADLIQRNIELKQFSYIISHNLRSPISKLLGLTTLVNNENNSKKFNEDLIRYIKVEAENLDNVVKDLNTIISDGELGSKVKRELIVFDTEIGLIQHVLENEIMESNTLIESDFTACSSIISVKSFVYSILFNLISNAIKYRSPKRQLRIKISTAVEKSNICLSVEDNGIGIDLERYGNQVFGLYNRFHSGDIPGKGMGLNLVKTQATTLGGWVAIESQPDVGTAFKVYIPAR